MRTTRCGDARERLRYQAVPVGCPVAEGAAGEIVPEIEVFQLQPGRAFVISGQQRQMHVGPARQLIEQRANAGHDTFAWSGLRQLGGKVAEIQVWKLLECGRAGRDVMGGGGVGENGRVGAAGHRDVAKRLTDRKQLLKRPCHRTYTGLAGEHERSVDVEQNECRQRRVASLRCERFLLAAPWPTVPPRSSRAALRSADRSCPGPSCDGRTTPVRRRLE